MELIPELLHNVAHRDLGSIGTICAKLIAEGLVSFISPSEMRHLYAFNFPSDASYLPLLVSHGAQCISSFHTPAPLTARTIENPRSTGTVASPAKFDQRPISCLFEMDCF